MNGTDFAILAPNLNQPPPVGIKGDFNYDNKANGNDFALLVANLGKAASGADVTIPASDLAAIDAFAAANGLMADVPEPATASIVAIGALGILDAAAAVKRLSPDGIGSQIGLGLYVSFTGRQYTEFVRLERPVKSDKFLTRSPCEITCLA